MLAKRIIPCLDIKDGRTVKGTNFLNLRDAGDPVELAVRYSENGADELVFLDITATVDKRRTLADLVRRIGRDINIPFTVGGGINSVTDIDALLNAGADKITINSAAFTEPELIEEAASNFGSQCIVLSIDAKKNGGSWDAYKNGGRVSVGIDAIKWAKQCEELGAGEILITSMDSDGMTRGFDIELTKSLSDSLSIPVIASGGAGKLEDFLDVFQNASADAALAASVFHYGEIEIANLKKYLKKNGVEVRY